MTNQTQPKALRLAQQLEYECFDAHAAELRRLHAECEALTKNAAAWLELYRRMGNIASAYRECCDERVSIRRLDSAFEAVEADALAAIAGNKEQVNEL